MTEAEDTGGGGGGASGNSFSLSRRGGSRGGGVGDLSGSLVLSWPGGGGAMGKCRYCCLSMCSATMVIALLVELLVVVDKLLLLEAELDSDIAEVEEVEFCLIE